MYRQYEDPAILEHRLATLEAQYANEPDNIDLAIDIAELKDRVNFAWQDDEAEINGWE